MARVLANYSKQEYWVSATYHELHLFNLDLGGGEYTITPVLDLIDDHLETVVLYRSTITQREIHFIEQVQDHLEQRGIEYTLRLVSCTIIEAVDLSALEPDQMEYYDVGNLDRVRYPPHTTKGVLSGRYQIDWFRLVDIFPTDMEECYLYNVVQRRFLGDLVHFHDIRVLKFAHNPELQLSDDLELKHLEEFSWGPEPVYLGSKMRVLNRIIKPKMEEHKCYRSAKVQTQFHIMSVNMQPPHNRYLVLDEPAMGEVLVEDLEDNTDWTKDYS